MTQQQVVTQHFPQLHLLVVAWAQTATTGLGAMAVVVGVDQI
jgi:hypothetical protein